MNLNLETEVQKHFDISVQCILHHGKLNSKVYLYTDEGLLFKDPFDFSNRELAKRTIKSMIVKTTAEMVIIIYQAFLSNSLNIPPSKAPDRRKAICVYGETREGCFVLYQEYESNGTHGSMLGEKIIVKDMFYGNLTGFFKYSQVSNLLPLLLSNLQSKKIKEGGE